MNGRITVESQPQIGSTFHLALTLKADAAQVPATSPAHSVRILSRKPALIESLSRHACALGMRVADGSDAGARNDIVLLDASTQRAELQSLLTAQPVSGKLIVIATAAEAEALGLRVLLDEKRLILKPVHRTTLREAFAAALGLRSNAPTDAASAVTATLSGHVLIVEDDPVNAAVAEGYLETLGCTFAWVTSGSEAVARSAAERFDLVLMDLNMPDMDGFAATALLRKSAPQGARVPIIALTAFDAAAYRSKCLQADMDDILSKPCTFDECTRVLQRWLGTNAPSVPVAEENPAAVNAGDLTHIDFTAVMTLRKLRADKHVDLYARLVGLFRSGSSQTLAQLKEAFANRDMRAAAALCHKLSSSAANVGALVYSAQVKELEQLCAVDDFDDARVLHDCLQAAHAPLLAALEHTMTRAAA
jgi:CheY-like chemotaxis protein/HPt (histidine-containing phosphotransfer) domain-containing protein